MNWVCVTSRMPRFCRVLSRFVIQKESLRRVLSRFCRLFCHSEGISTSRFLSRCRRVLSRVLSFRRNLYVAFLSRFCRVVVACFVIQKESLRRVFVAFLLHCRRVLSFRRNLYVAFFLFTDVTHGCRAP
jgi:hypothetical protein